MAQVTSLYKKGDKTETSDYKPTSILPTLSKILVWPLHYRLVNYFELSNLLSEIQYGYRKKHFRIHLCIFN